MSWWRSLENEAGALFNKVTGHASAAERREQAAMVQDQINAYKQQTEITQKAMADAKAQQDVEKRRINEKQIRSLRNNFRAPGGFLAGGADMSSNSSLPNKLGTA